MTSLDHSTSLPTDERLTATAGQQDVTSAVLGIVALVVVGFAIIVSVVCISTALIVL